MANINKLHLGIGLLIAILAFIGLYLFYSLVPHDLSVGVPQIGNVEIPEESGEAYLSIVGAYWGTSDFPMNQTDTCSNETKNFPNTTFTIEANSRIVAPNYDECFVVNNEEKLETKIIEMHGNYINVQAKAETDRANVVKICCLLEERLDCSNTTTLLKCN